MADAATTAATDKDTTAAGDNGGGATTATATATGGQGGTTTAATTTAATIADGTTDDKTAVTPADWPADWRTKLSGGDDKLQKRLERYTTPKAIADALLAAQDRIRSGELKTVLAKDAKPEEVAAWRKENGIPDAPEGYLEKLPNGLVIGEADKPAMTDFAKSMHEANVPPEMVHRALGWYFQQQERVQAERVEQDADNWRQTEDALRTEWGPEYRRNTNMIIGFLDTAPEGVKEAILFARGPDGIKLGGDPKVLSWLAGLAREMNPAGTVVPGGGDTAAAIGDEIAKIKGWMAAGPKSAEGKKYWGDPKTQARYQELVAAQQRIKSRAA